MAKRAVNKGAWTADEDRKLSQYVEMHGPNKWKSVAIKSGLNRCGKSCRLRWLNYLRPDIKRGNISHAEDDLILRLHRLLGNKWSLIARRLPGRTDNEIKNYWNAHLRKKANLMENLPASSIALSQHDWHDDDNDDDKAMTSMGNSNKESIISGDDDADELRSDEDEDEDEDEDGCSDLSTGGRSNGLDWVKTFLELEEEEEPQN